MLTQLSDRNVYDPQIDPFSFEVNGVHFGAVRPKVSWTGY